MPAHVLAIAVLEDSFSLHWKLYPPTKIAYDIHVYDTQVYGICTVTFFYIYI